MDEEDGAVTVFVSLFEGELTGDVVVRLTTSDGSATSSAPRDYTSVTEDLTFGPTSTRVSVDILITDDDTVESIKDFFA